MPRFGLRAALASAGLVLSPAFPSRAQESPRPASRMVRVDRTVVRFTAPEIGGMRSPHFIWERELSFEARLEALTDAAQSGTTATSYTARHVQRALERHVAETLLENLEMTPEPTFAEVQRLAEVVRVRLIQQVGGVRNLASALLAEGITQNELSRLLRRRALASLYLDRMVAPMLHPSEAELRAIHRAIKTPFAKQPFEAVRDALRRWFIARRLASAVSAFYDSARARVKLVTMPQFSELGLTKPGRPVDK